MDYELRALVSNIQRYCLHDGDGIRTTIFFMGCPLRCAWCHNPEGQLRSAQSFFYEERCRDCGRCANESSHNASGCIYGACEAVGKLYTPRELIEEAERDAPFYKSSGGGVTLSGGEVMTLPLDFFLPLVRGLKQKGFHLAIDTCGHAPFEAFEAVLPYTDIFLYDVKLIDRERHLRLTGQGNELILSNIKRLSDMGAALDVRIPVIEGVNADDAEMDAILNYLMLYVKAKHVTLLPYHSIGEQKYRRLGLAAPVGFQTSNAERMNELTRRFIKSGLPAQTE